MKKWLKILGIGTGILGWVATLTTIGIMETEGFGSRGTEAIERFSYQGKQAIVYRDNKIASFDQYFLSPEGTNDKLRGEFTGDDGIKRNVLKYAYSPRK